MENGNISQYSPTIMQTTSRSSQLCSRHNWRWPARFKMPEFFGLQLAPFKLPPERRLQMVAILIWVASLMFSSFLGTLGFAYLIFFTNYWDLPLLYLLWLWYDMKTCERGGRRINWVRHWSIWKYMRDYFPVRLIKTADLDPNKNYICGYHPHGVIVAGAFPTFGSEALDFSKKFPGIRPSVLTLRGNFNFPIYRDYLMATGACAVNRESIHWLLSNEGKGVMVIIVVGGAKEALDAHPADGSDIRLTLRRRKGFVRQAIMHGANLVPVFSFGENDVYEQLPNPEGSFLRRIQDLVTKFVGVSPPAFHGRGVFQYNFGFVPFRRPIDVVVGKPIDVEKIEHPTEAEVDHYHNIYVESLIKLFEEHKVNYENYKEAKLVV